MARAPHRVPNIGPRERRRRLVVGIVLSSLTAVVAIYLIAADTPRVWRLLIALPAGAAGLGLFQAQASTCVALARLGMRNMDAGNEPVTDPEHLGRISEQSRRVYVRALCAAILVAAITLVL